MKQRPRIYYTETQKDLMWDRWQKGESLHQIAQLFDRSHSSIQRILAETGLRDELIAHGPSGRWKVLRRIMVVMLKAYRLQVEYEKAKSKHDINVEFLEGSTLLTKRDLKNIEEAAAVNGQIRKRLSDLKKRRTS